MEDAFIKGAYTPWLHSGEGVDSHSVPMPIRFSVAEDPPNHLRFDMFPTSFPPIAGHLANLFCTEKEMADLFGQFTGYPLSTPLVTRIIEQYLPLRAIAHQEKIWTMKYWRPARGHTARLGGWCSEDPHPSKGLLVPLPDPARQALLGRMEPPRCALLPSNYSLPCYSANT